MTRRYDLIIIGTGTAAMVAAMQIRAAGWTVAVIDFRPFGGTCALRGCDPKKMLIAGAETVDRVARMRGHGVAGEVTIDWPGLIAFKRTFTDPIPQMHERSYAEHGIDTFHGHARFTDRNTVAVDGTAFKGRHFLIAAGAEPIQLGIPGAEHLVTSEEFLALESLPRRIVLVGGGYIAAEFAHIAARAGAQVTIVERAERMLKRFDPDLVGWLMEKFRVIGVDVRTRTVVEAIEKTDGEFTLRVSSERNSETIEADLAVHAAGRAPALEALDLGAGGIAVQNGRLMLNEFLQSVSNPAVYAAGDAAEVGPPLTPVSIHDAEVAVVNLLQGNRQRPNYLGVPTVAFTIPPIAAVGLSEAQARDRGLKFRMQTQKASDWYTARRVAEPTYGFKVLVEEPSKRILGAHLVGPNVDEVINVFALAIRHGVTADALKTTVFAYPTGASDIEYMI